MNKMLTKRLQKIVDAIPLCNTLADVGCDHGYIGIAALSENKAQNVVFIDISAPSLAKAKQNLPCNLCQKATFVHADGLGNIIADCAVIAGMGGLEIMSILSGAADLPQMLVLQPMKNQYELRRFLLADYNVESDELFFDGKYYDLIVARKCAERQTLSELQLRFGLSNLKAPSDDFAMYVRNEQQKLISILKQCGDSSVKARLELVNTVAAVIREEQI